MYFDFPHYPFSTPPELQGQRLLHPIAIIGAGPVDLTLALALVRYGIPVVLLERRDTVSEGSRAICISRHSIEILALLDIGQRLLSRGIAWTGGRSFYSGIEDAYNLAWKLAYVIRRLSVGRFSRLTALSACTQLAKICVRQKRVHCL